MLSRRFSERMALGGVSERELKGGLWGLRREEMWGGWKKKWWEKMVGG